MHSILFSLDSYDSAIIEIKIYILNNLHHCINKDEIDISNLNMDTIDIHEN